MKISIPALYQKYQECSSVSTDTRKIETDALFFALKGPNFDANAFAKDALEKGAKYAVIDDPAYEADERFLLVEDGLLALQKLALHHRRILTIPFIGLTGSNGKTTTKELIASVLSKKYKTYATRGNLNNHIGVPLTVLAIDTSVEIAVIEMGANKQGDIKELVEICEPTHGLITNIGKAHLEGFGGVAGVKKGKGELFDFLSRSEGVVFVNGNQPALLDMQTGRHFKETVFYQQAEGFCNAVLLEDNPVVVYKSENEEIVKTQLTGKYNFDNIATALCVGKYFGVSTAEASAAIAAYNPDNNRSQIIQRSSNTIIMDAYNANPSSMMASVQNFNNMIANKKMVILGDMFELGTEAPTEHEAIGKLISTCHFDYVLLVGALMQHALVHLPKAYYFPDKFGLHTWLQDHPMQNTHILVKGSRGMGLESVLKVIPE